MNISSWARALLVLLLLGTNVRLNALAFYGKLDPHFMPKIPGFDPNKHQKIEYEYTFSGDGWLGFGNEGLIGQVEAETIERISYSFKPGFTGPTNVCRGYIDKKNISQTVNTFYNCGQFCGVVQRGCSFQTLGGNCENLSSGSTGCQLNCDHGDHVWNVSPSAEVFSCEASVGTDGSTDGGLIISTTGNVTTWQGFKNCSAAILYNSLCAGPHYGNTRGMYFKMLVTLTPNNPTATLPDLPEGPKLDVGPCVSELVSFNGLKWNSNDKFQFNVRNNTDLIGGILKAVTIQYSTDLLTWNNLTTSSQKQFSVTDSGSSSSILRRMYRAKTADSCCSQLAIGFLNKSLSTGSSQQFLSQPFIPELPYVRSVFSASGPVQSGTAINIWDPEIQNWKYTDYWGSWSEPNYNLNQGESFLIGGLSTAANIHLMGYLPVNMDLLTDLRPNLIENAGLRRPFGFNLVSGGLPTMNGMKSYKWNYGTQAFVQSTYTSPGGSWSINHLFNEGEGHLLLRPSSGTWSQNNAMNCP